jgi:cyclohexanone monooxygenase
LDVVIVGAGFAGLFMLHRLRGLGLSARVLESAGGVGGTWYWNRYPGARCDVESMQYSYSFSPDLQQEWVWTERYASQPEILRYANHVADRFDLWGDISLDTRVASAVLDANQLRWTVTTEAGDVYSARFCVMATGCLSNARVPDVPGLDGFAGETYHTGQWPHHEVDFSGKRVAVIGTGSSAIQAIPVIAAQAAHLTVFQRTPNFSVPAHNAPLRPADAQGWKADYPALRERARKMRSGILYELNPQSALEVSEAERTRVYEARWLKGSTQFMAAFGDLLTSKAANDTAVAFLHDKIRGIVHDPATAEALLPRDHPVGTKRLCVDTGYFATYNRDNVTLVDLRRTPIAGITETAIRTTTTDHDIDCIVFATGFDAMTGALLRIDIRGRDGLSLAAKWAAGPRTQLGVMSAGFPNFFFVTGPGSPSVMSNMIVSIEQHVDWITDCLAYLRTHDAIGIEANPDAEDRWVAHVNEVADKTLYPTANSWYMGANIPGKPRIFMPYVGGVGVYRELCDAVAAQAYPGFHTLRRDPVVAAAE